jgi:ectoine hydroxylase-related dioxygenase (phytanoyl-CoA dioxygenase family)
MHADIGRRDQIDKWFAFPDPVHPGRTFCDLPAPVVKVYFPMVDLDHKTGPPLFVPGSHWKYTTEDVPAEDPPGSIFAYCRAGSAILMDMRVWHHGTPNHSSIARATLAVHYAGPWYNEDILKNKQFLLDTP